MSILPVIAVRVCVCACGPVVGTRCTSPCTLVRPGPAVPGARGGDEHGLDIGTFISMCWNGGRRALALDGSATRLGWASSVSYGADRYVTRPASRIRHGIVYRTSKHTALRARGMAIERAPCASYWLSGPTERWCGALFSVHSCKAPHSGYGKDRAKCMCHGLNGFAADLASCACSAS
jgi:hypothetical protein